MQRGILVLLAVAVVAAGAPRARGQEPENTQASVDSLMFGPRFSFSPAFNNRVDGGVSSVGMFNQFRTSLRTRYGPVFDFDVSKDEKHYRLRDGRDETKGMSLLGLYNLRPGMTTSLNLSDTRIFSRTVVSGGSFQDFIINDQVANAAVAYTGQQSGARLDWRAMGNAGQGERTYKNDQTVSGAINGGVAYNLIGKHVIVQARGSLRESADQSRTTLQEFNGLGASEDSVASVVRVSLADSTEFQVEYKDYNGVRDYTDQAQGSLGGQVSGAENVFEEHETRSTQSTVAHLYSEPWDRFNIDLTALHEEQLYDYEIQKTRYSRTVGTTARGRVGYTMPWQTTANVQFENTETLRDLGPQSVASFNEKRKRVALTLGHQLSKTFRADFSASTQLTQSFYVDYNANPRDRDQVDNLLSLRFNSQPYRKISANITMSYSSTEFINIDASQSRNNRTRQLYELRPGFTYTMNQHLSVTQTYGLVIDYTDYVYQASENFLDRNLTFSNVIAFRPTQKVQLRVDYGLYLHDKGSYLPTGPDGQDQLEVSGEDRRDRMGLRIEYQVTEDVQIFAENLYSHFLDREVSSGFETITTDGSVQVGTTGSKDWGNNRKFKFALSRVKRFSPFGSDKEKDYWDMRSELNFPL
ncbi:MAG TPA: hypothetical protein VFX92_02210 [Candidatus Krumholzibacteria bacterium]|nr:hypothetical protein [Candidatus Krumholzibacteria bacterium]